MKSRVLALFTVSFAILFAVAFTGDGIAEQWEGESASCGGWVNCSTDSPNYTGICCRVCRDRSETTFWNCKRVPAEREAFAPTAAGRLPAGEATITGIVTKEGVLKADAGHGFAVAGDKADMLQKNMGKRIEVRGTVQEAEGKVTIEVDAYEWMGLGEAQAVQTSGSCSQWMNCDARSPTFTGTCCRQCRDAAGAAAWDCRVFSVGEHFDLAEWAD